MVLGLTSSCLPLAVQLRSMEAKSARVPVDNDDGVSVCSMDALVEPIALGLQSCQQIMNRLTAFACNCRMRSA